MAKVPGYQNCTIAPSKISYLLTPRQINDKSKYLARFGFNNQNTQLLEAALREHIQQYDYISQRDILDWTQTPPTTVVGHNYVVRGNLQTPDGRNPTVRTVWNVIGGGSPDFNTSLGWHRAVWAPNCEIALGSG
jgi:hypothetical protein